MAVVSWKSGVSGDWATAANWSNGTVPGSGDDVTIGASGTYTVTINGPQAARSLSLKAAGATVVDSSTLSMNGALTLTAGTFQLNSGGVISGATLSATGGVFLWNGGTLNGDTYRGTIDMSAANSVLRIGAAGLIATGSGGSGNGTIDLTGNGDQLVVTNNQTLDKATINIGGASGYATIYDYDTTSTNHTTTFGAGLTINQTGVDAQLADYVGYAGDGFVNAGKIVAGVNGGQFLISSQSFANAGTIAVSNGDTMTINSANWSNSGAMTVTGATLRLNGAFTSASLAKITSNSSTVIIGGTVTNSGPALAVGTGAKLAQLTLASSGSINGGTIKDAGAGFVWNSGTLSGVTYDGTLDMSAAGSVLKIGAGGLTAKNAAGTGPGTISLTGSGSQLIVLNNQTLDNATINIGAASGNATIYDYDTTSTAHTTTFGAGLTINQTGVNVLLADYVGYTGDGFINQGKIVAGVNGGQFAINSTTFANAGTISVSNGDTMTINSANWANGGAMTVTGATLRLNGAFTSASLAKITNRTSTVIVGGTVTNSGPALAVGTGTKLAQLTLTGTINGGTIKDAGAGFVWNSGTLSGVTYNGTLDMSAAGAVLKIGAGGLIAKNAAGTGPGTISLTGGGSQLIVLNNQTLDNATINIGAASGNATIYDYDTTSTNHTTTFGAGLTINQTGVNVLLADYVGYTGDGFINRGKIVAGVNGGQFAINSTTFANAGTISVSNGDTMTINSANWANGGAMTVNGATLRLNGAFTSASLARITNHSGTVIVAGTVTNSGPALAVGTGAKLAQLTLASSGSINGGTIKDAGAGFVWNSGTLSGVTYDGTLDMSAAGSVLKIGAGGLTAKNAAGTGPGTISLTGGGSQLVTVNNQTLDNATINIGAASGNATIYDYDTTSTNHTTTFGVGLTINQTGANAVLADYVGYAGDGFVNRGKIVAAIVGGRFTIQCNTFNNLGSIAVGAGELLSLTPTNLTNFASGTLTGGTFEADGGSTFELTNNTLVTTLAATVILNGAGSTLQSLNTTGNVQATIDSTLKTIARAGTLEVIGGRDWTSSNVINNLGNVILGGGKFAVASLTNNGTVSGYGVVATKVTNNGVVTAGAGQTLSFVGGSLTNLVGTTLTGGQFTVAAGGTMRLANNLSIVTDNALITLNGASSALESYNTTSKTQVTIDSTLTAITATGALELLGHRNWSSTKAMTSAGQLILGGGSFAPTSLISTGTVSGFGTLATAFTNNGALSVTASNTLSLVGGSLKNLGAGVLTGGTFTVANGATLRLANNTSIAKLAAAVTLDDGSVIEGLKTAGSIQVTLESSLTTIEAQGNLALVGGRDYSSTNVISNSGTLRLGGGTFSTGKLSDLAGSTLTGFGTVASVFSSAGVVRATGGTLTFTGAGDTFAGTLSGAGTIAMSGGSNSLSAITLTAASLDASHTTITAHGTITNTTAIDLTVSTFTVTTAGATLSGGGDVVLSNAAANKITGATLASTLTNADNTISGAGSLGAGRMKLVNQAAGQIVGKGTVALKIDTGSNTITNAGLIEADGSGGVAIAGAVTNTGTLEARLGTLSVAGPVSGAGVVVIAGGTASFASTFNEAVSFTTSGTLTLARSASYAGKISGFSLTGATSLDLRDIGFVSADEATYSGTASGGVLTVTDGTHTAKINLVGDYTHSTFEASSDGSGGVIVVDPMPQSHASPATTPAAFVAAMAAMGSGHAAMTPSFERVREAPAMLSVPRPNLA